MRKIKDLPRITEVGKNFNPIITEKIPVWHPIKTKNQNYWKKHFTLWNLFSAVCFAAISYFAHDLYELQKRIDHDELFYNRVEYLINEGYSLEAAKHITKVELGDIPADSEYNALIED